MEKILCKDCKNSKTSFFNKIFTKSPYGYQCMLPEAFYTPPPDKTLGLDRPGYFESCNVARVDPKICGPDAKNWVPRDTAKVFTFLKRI
jgi:hypothetical protein